MRRQFQLAQEDMDGLASRGLKWEAILENNARWLLLHDYPIPQGYNCGSALAGLRIPPSYPDDQIDMIYFSPALALASGKGVLALTPLQIDGKPFQQWSRHRTGANPWRPNLDNICTHLLLADSWLDRELVA